MWLMGRPPHWVGRAHELAVLSTAVEDLRGGAGSVVWIEGEPGIGKSSLVAEAMAANDPGSDISWAMADQLTERLPLRVMLDCLQVRPGSSDPRRARAAGLLRNRQLSLLAGGDASATGVEVLVALVDELCAATPTVMVIDDLQWADEASLVVWHQLAASIRQLRLLLIGTCRPTPRRPAVEQVRTAVVRRGGAVITLEPLPETDVADLVTAIVGAPPGNALRQLTAQAAGNPLYVRELIDALMREQAVRVRPIAEIAMPGEQLPVSLAGVLTDRLSSVSPETAQLLRAAALLGGGFAATDLAVVLRLPVSGLAANLQEAVTAGILAGSGTELVFRHPLIRQALYESMPLALRMALHAEAARELAAAGADALSVAQQLSAARRRGEGWDREWLIQSASALATRAPQLAVELLQRELDATPSGSETWDSLMVSLLWAQLAAGSHQEAARQASWALTVVTDAARRAETYWVLAHAQVSAGRGDDAITTIRQALAPADLPGKWHARMLAMLAMLERGASGFDVADTTARQALTAAEAASDPFATAHALTDLWLTCSIGRDHAAALDHIDRALRVLGDDPGHADLRAVALDARTFTLQNLDEWPQAELALRQAREFAQRTGSPDRATLANAAVLRYWLGQWDDALAELGSDAADSPGLMYSFLRERWSALLTHGVTALIAGHRDQRTAAGQQLRKGLALPIENVTDRENQDFLVAAHALALEQSGETRQAMTRLAEILPRHDDEMTLTHQWLPDLVRLALAAGDGQLAQTAAQACQAEAAAETRPARATAASLRCRGLLESDPGPLQDAVAHYRAVGAPRGASHPGQRAVPRRGRPDDDRLRPGRQPVGYGLHRRGRAARPAGSSDLNGSGRTGFGIAQSNIRDGVRHSVVDGYLRPALGRPNLAVRTGAPVAQVLFNGRKATGVRLRAGQLVTAGRGVILAAGSLRTPQLLMLSGVGPANHLSAHGIPVLADLPGVGANLHDHPMISPVWPITSGTTLLDAQDETSQAAYRLARRGPLASVAQALAMLPLLDGEAPDLQVYFTLMGFEPGLVPMSQPAVTALTVLLTPASRGTVRLRSADPDDPLIVDPAYLADETDRKALRQGLDQIRALFRAPALAAITGPALRPAPSADDSELDAFISQSLVSIWHPVGTCRMGSSADAVVSPRLAVHGLEKLYVADASVMPTITRGNTHAPTIIIAEKAASLLADS